MLTQKTGWKITQTMTDINRKQVIRELMVVYDKEEAKKILEFFADSEKYRKDPFTWFRKTCMDNDVMYITYEHHKSPEETQLRAKKINFVEEGGS